MILTFIPSWAQVEVAIEPLLLVLLEKNPQNPIMFVRHIRLFQISTLEPWLS